MFPSLTVDGIVPSSNRSCNDFPTNGNPRCATIVYITLMDKARAIQNLGGTVEAAKKCGCSHQAISKWPDELPRRIADRVIAAIARDGKKIPDWMLK